MSTPAIPSTYNGNPRVAAWFYSGTVAVARFDTPDGGKDCVPFKLNGGGWQPGAPPEPRPLYGLDTLERPGPVFVCEGEKCCAALHGLGLAAVASMGGADAPHKSDWRPLRGCEVVILPDANEPGERYAQAVAGLLDTPPRVLRLEGLPPAGDIVDWIQARLPAWNGYEALDGADALEMADALRAALEGAQPLEVTDLEISGDWPDPVPLPTAPPVPAFDPACLPEKFQAWCTDIADRMGCAPEFPAVAAMVAAGTLIGRQVFIRPKARDAWQEPCNLWGAAIGNPAAMKSPAMLEALQPLRALEAKAAGAHDGETAIYEREAAAWKSVEAAVKKKAAKCTDMESARAALDELPDPPTPPVHRRYYTSDATPEKLCTILQDNPHGVLVLLDELSGLFHSFQRQGREGSRQLYLTGWGGKESHTVDRIARGTGYIPAVCISLLGTIQPGVLRELLLQDDARDGLAARLQLAVWPDLPAFASLESRDRLPDFAARDSYFQTMERLAALDPRTLDAEHDERTNSHFLRFDADAQSLFYKWHDALLQRVRDDDMPGALCEHLSKYRGLLPRLALISHIADGGRGPVAMPAFMRAQALCELLEAHAHRMYAAASPEIALAKKALKALPEVMENGRVSQRILQRKLLRNGPATPEFQAAIEMLEAHNYLKRDRADRTGGTRAFIVHPEIRRN